MGVKIKPRADGARVGVKVKKGRLRSLVQSEPFVFVSAPLLMPQSLVDNVDNADITRGHP
jgi:hypothetical protein